MTAVPPFPPADAPAALSAFVRGVERRALVVAQLHCGEPGLAERVLAAALAHFREQAGDDLMAAWPVRFWHLLAVASQALPPQGHWRAPFTALAYMAPGDRLALLLRIAAGLDEPMAADVLGIAEDDYRQALGRACPRDVSGQPDAAAWRGLAEAVQARVRALSPQELDKLGRLREAALTPPPSGRGQSLPSGQDTPSPRVAKASTAGPDHAIPVARRPAPVLRRRSRPMPRRWSLPALLAGTGFVAVLVVGGVWWWWRPPVLPPEPVSQALPGALHVVDAGPALVEELPAADAPSAPVPTAAIDRDDAAMLADPELGLARQADFLAWYAAGGPLPVDESDTRPSAPAPASAPLETADDEN